MMQGVLYSHRANYLHALAFLLPDVADVSSRDTLMMVVPMFHVRPTCLSPALRFFLLFSLPPGGPMIRPLMEGPLRLF